MAPNLELSDLPVLLTVEEAARVLRIGRSMAYELVNRYLATGGLDGIPATRIGSMIRVPRWALIEWLTTAAPLRIAPRPIHPRRLRRRWREHDLCAIPA